MDLLNMDYIMCITKSFNFPHEYDQWIRGIYKMKSIWTKQWPSSYYTNSCDQILTLYLQLWPNFDPMLTAVSKFGPYTHSCVQILTP